MSRGRSTSAPFVPGIAPEDLSEEELDLNGVHARIRETALAGLPTRERDYLVPAKDQKGTSVRFQCRASPEYGRMLSELLQSRKYPFRVQGDLIRWAIVDGIRRLAKGAGISSVLNKSEAIRQILIDEEYHLEFDDHCRVVKRTIDRYLQRRAPSQARALLLRLQHEISEMPEGYWKEQYTTHLTTEYGYLMEGQRGTGLEGSAISMFVPATPPTEIPTRPRMPRPGEDE